MKSDFLRRFMDPGTIHGGSDYDIPADSFAYVLSPEHDDDNSIEEREEIQEDDAWYREMK